MFTKRFAVALVALVAVATLQGIASAQPFDARGTFNGWGQTPMTDNLDGTYSVTIGALVPGALHDWKIDTGNWASSWPGSNVTSAVDAAGNMTLHFRPGPIADGWSPAADRVGYSDPGQFGWEIMGSFNNWDALVDTAARQMTDLGSGLYSVDYTIATPGMHSFKFRESNSWAVSTGDDFGNAAANISVTTTVPNELLTFQLDLPNGRFQVVPEPAALTLLGGVIGFVLMRRRH